MLPPFVWLVFDTAENDVVGIYETKAEAAKALADFWACICDDGDGFDKAEAFQEVMDTGRYKWLEVYRHKTGEIPSAASD